MKRDWFTIVGICLVLVLALYVGAYLFCVDVPKSPWARTYAEAVRMRPGYTFRGRPVNGPLIQQLFAPIYSLDIQLRPSCWTGRHGYVTLRSPAPTDDPYEAVRQACDFTRPPQRH